MGSHTSKPKPDDSTSTIECFRTEDGLLSITFLKSPLSPPRVGGISHDTIIISTLHGYYRCRSIRYRLDYSNANLWKAAFGRIATSTALKTLAGACTVGFRGVKLRLWVGEAQQLVFFAARVPADGGDANAGNPHHHHDKDDGDDDMGSDRQRGIGDGDDTDATIDSSINITVDSARKARAIARCMQSAIDFIDARIIGDTKQPHNPHPNASLANIVSNAALIAAASVPVAAPSIVASSDTVSDTDTATASAREERKEKKEVLQSLDRRRQQKRQSDRDDYDTEEGEERGQLQDRRRGQRRTRSQSRIQDTDNEPLPKKKRGRPVAATPRRDKSDPTRRSARKTKRVVRYDDDSMVAVAISKKNQNARGRGRPRWIYP